VEKREAPKQKAADAEGQGSEPADGMAAIETIIGRVQKSLMSKDAKASVADLVRLLELRRELSQSQPRPVIVRWIDECQQTSDDEE
jgi:hypothetical protein